MRAGEAFAAGNQKAAAMAINIMLTDAEAEMLRFDNNEILILGPVNPAAASSILAETLLKLDDYWQKHPRPIAFGERVNAQEYGWAAGTSINAGRAAYETVYSNAVARAKARLRK